MDRTIEYDTESLLTENESLSRRNRLLARENTALLIENRHHRLFRSEITEKMTDIILDRSRLCDLKVDSLSDEMRALIQEENQKLASTIMSNELKRKGDHQPVVIQNEQVGDVADTIVCNRCKVEFPISTFREKAKRKDKNGEFFIAEFTRRMCRPCRRKKATDQEAETTKKTKVT